MIVCSLLLIWNGLWAQSVVEACGTEVTVSDIAYIQNLRQSATRQNKKQVPDDTVYIPIMAHIITLDNGFGGISVASIRDELAVVNQLYASSKVQYYLCDSIHYIQDSRYYVFEKSVDEDSTADLHDRPNMLNIYFAEDLYRINNSNDTVWLCGYAYFPSNPPKDRIFMSNGCSTNGSTLAHEIGHYMSLLHTHDRSFGNELVDGSNCSSAGDLFCDTPADPNVSGKINVNCQYTGSSTDGNGQAYNPDPSNIMSYSRKSCRDYFSPEQIQAVAATFINERDYLFNKPFTEFTAVQNSLDVAFIPNRVNDSIITVTWDFGDGNYSSVTDPVHHYTDTGTYTACLTAENLCATYTQCETIVVTCDGKLADFTYTDTVDGNLTVQFNTVFSDSTDISWSMGDGTAYSTPNVAHTYDSAGEYDVNLFVASECGWHDTTITITVNALVVSTGLETYESEDSLFIYPMPSVSELNIHNVKKLSNWVILNTAGKVMLSGLTSQTGQLRIDISQLPVGIYMLATESADHMVQTGRFVKAE